MIKRLRKSLAWKSKGKKTKDIAKKLEISNRKVQQVWKMYQETGEIPKLKRRGRKPKQISKETTDLALMLFGYIKERVPCI
jgi:transposase